MDKVRLGKTELTVNKNGFGALPIQRITKKEAVYLLQKAFYNGINYFDTARAYTDSEEKMGAAFEYTRDKIIISTKTGAQKAEDFWKDLETSLKMLKTDYIDIYQLHNPAFCPKPGDESGLYDAMVEAKKQGKIRHIGITNHRLAAVSYTHLRNEFRRCLGKARLLQSALGLCGQIFVTARLSAQHLNLVKSVCFKSGVAHVLKLNFCIST